MPTFLWVALGGAAGSLARYLLGGGMNARFSPWGTVVINVVGSFLLGVIVGRWGWGDLTPHRVGLSVGLLGGFTTFSTFSVDVVRLWEAGQVASAVFIVAVSVVFGVAAAFIGISLGRV